MTAPPIALPEEPSDVARGTSREESKDCKFVLIYIFAAGFFFNDTVPNPKHVVPADWKTKPMK